MMPQKPRPLKEAKEAKEVIEEAKKIAKKMLDNANALLKEETEEPEAEQAANVDKNTDGDGQSQLSSDRQGSTHPAPLS